MYHREGKAFHTTEGEASRLTTNSKNKTPQKLRMHRKKIKSIPFSQKANFLS